MRLKRPTYRSESILHLVLMGGTLEGAIETINYIKFKIKHGGPGWYDIYQRKGPKYFNDIVGFLVGEIIVTAHEKFSRNEGSYLLRCVSIDGGEGAAVLMKYVLDGPELHSTYCIAP